MGRRGPKPKSEDNVLSVPGISEKRPAPPPGMSKLARLLWKRIVASLPTTHFRPGDYPLLRDYCEAENDIIEAREAIERDGRFLPGARGGLVSHPGFAQIIAAGSLKAQLATKLRLCANSRLSNSKAAYEKPETSKTQSARKGLMFGGA